MNMRIKSICSWCGKDLGTKVVEASQEMLDTAAGGNMPKSGGICAPCSRQLLEDAEVRPSITYLSRKVTRASKRRNRK